MYQLYISRIAEKQIASFPKHIANNIREKIDLLASEPRPFGCKKLEGSKDEYRLRTGDYRIIYRIEDNRLIVEVIRIGNRKDVYRKR